MKYLIILSFILSSNSFAVIPIKEGQKSPEAGYVFNTEEEKKVRGINEKRIKLEDLSLKQEELSKVQEDKISTLESELSNEKKRNSWTNTKKVIYFISGMLVTGVLITIGRKI